MVLRTSTNIPFDADCGGDQHVPLAPALVADIVEYKDHVLHSVRITYIEDVLLGGWTGRRHSNQALNWCDTLQWQIHN